jgi:hypothetical protein
LLQSRGVWTPEHPQTIGASYITDTAMGRRVVRKSLQDIMAAGVTINTNVLYPGDVGLGNEGRDIDDPKTPDKVWVWSDADEI